MKIATILDQVDLGIMALPEFKRGYVWNRDQVCGLAEAAANQAGFRYFSDPDAFRSYARSDILALDAAAI